MANEKKETKLIVEQPAIPIETKVLAQAIVNISDGVTKLLKNGLNRRAIVVLLHANTGEYKGAIERVLDGLENLKRDYVG